MKKINILLKFSALLLLIVMMISCNKEEDPRIINTPATEAALIKQWKAAMIAEELQVDSTASGIYYIIDTTQTGTGPNVKTGDKVTVKYAGYFLDGTVFDASNGYTYIHKDTDPTKRMITGWEEGIELMNKGAKIAFLFPSSKAYGATGSYRGIIPPYTPLIFVIEVTNIQ